MGAIKDLWKSERGLVAISLIAACTVLGATSIITPGQWLDYTKWVFITYAAAKTVTGVAALATAPAVAPPTAADISAAVEATIALRQQHPGLVIVPLGGPPIAAPVPVAVPGPVAVSAPIVSKDP